MRLTLLTTLCIVTISGIYTSETANSAGFRYFLENALTNYDAWLKASADADPSPILLAEQFSSSSVWASLFIIDYKIGYEQIVGQVTKAKSRDMQVNVDLIAHKISIVTATVGDIILQGNYSATGEVNLEKELALNSSGSWSVSCTQMIDTYDYTFELGPQGEVIIDLESRYKSPYFTTQLEIEEQKTEFEGLWENNEEINRFAPEFKKQMSIEIQERYQKSWNRGWEKHPTGRLMHKFLNETFQNAPVLTEIIKTNKPADKENLVKAASVASANYETPTSSNLRLFLTNVMNKYDSWLNSAKEADPTPLNPVDSGWIGNSVSENLFRFYYMLHYEQMQGFVKARTERRIECVSVDLLNFQISIVVVTVGKTVFHGNFTIDSGELNVGPTLPLTGFGVWNVTCSSVKDVYDFKFKISPDGYILIDLDDIHTTPYVKSYLEMEEDKTYFEGLWDEDDKVKPYAPELRYQMTKEIGERYEKWNDDWELHPTGNLLHRFLNETFGTAPLLTDIMEGKWQTDGTSPAVTSTTPLADTFSPETTPAVTNTPLPGTFVPEPTTPLGQRSSSSTIQSISVTILLVITFIFNF